MGKQEDYPLEEAKEASIDALSEQIESWKTLHDTLVDHLIKEEKGQGVNVFVSGDLNPRTISVPREFPQPAADPCKALFYAVMKGKAIFRAKYDPEKTDFEERLFQLQTICPVLNNQV